MVIFGSCFGTSSRYDLRGTTLELLCEGYGLAPDLPHKNLRASHPQETNLFFASVAYVEAAVCLPELEACPTVSDEAEL